MPTVRKLNRQVSTDAIPGARLTAAETGDSLGAGAQRAKADTAGTLAHVAGGLAGQAIGLANQQAERARAHANDVAALNWQTRVDEFELEQVYGPNGALAKQGQEALGSPEAVEAGYGKLASEIEQGLTPEQRVPFAKFKQQRGAHISLSVRRHTAGQMKAYEDERFKSVLTNTVNLAAAKALTPELAGEDIARGEVEIQKYGARNGEPPEATTVKLEAFRSAAHRAIIDNLLAADQDRRADIYFSEKGKEILGTQRDEVKAQIAAGTTAKAGREASDTIWAELKPTSDTEPFDLEKMEDRARALFPDDEKALKATMLNLRERKAAAVDARNERKDAIGGALWGAVAKGQKLAQVQAMPEYRNAPGHLQAQISEHIVQEAEQAANRDYTRRQRNEAAIGRAESQKERGGWAEMWRYNDPAVLSTMNDNQILALIPTLGTDHVNRLMATRRSLTSSEGKLRDAKTDLDLFKATAAAGGFNAFNPKTDDEKADLGQLLNAVEGQIAAEQQGGKLVTRERKQQIQREIQDEKVLLRTWGRHESRVAATVVRPEERAIAYVPIAKVDPAALGEARAYLRRISTTAQRMTDAKVDETFGDRIQRGYARTLMGGSRAEVENILRGGED